MESTNILISPMVTEKSVTGQQSHKYTFKVRSGANKVEIAKAVESAYGVKVVSVNVVTVLKKVRKVGRSKTITKRHAAKKAIVTVRAKDSIDFNKFTKVK